MSGTDWMMMTALNASVVDTVVCALFLASRRLCTGTGCAEFRVCRVPGEPRHGRSACVGSGSGDLHWCHRHASSSETRRRAGRRQSESSYAALNSRSPMRVSVPSPQL